MLRTSCVQNDSVEYKNQEKLIANDIIGIV